MSKSLCIRLCGHLIFSILSLLSFHSANAQTRADTLDAISKQMYSEGNRYFLIIEAYKDGFIREDQRFDYQKFDKDSLVTIDGKIVPEPYQSRYLSLIASFNAANPNNKAFGSLICDGINMNKVLDPSSTIRTGGPRFVEVIYDSPPRRIK